MHARLHQKLAERAAGPASDTRWDSRLGLTGPLDISGARSLLNPGYSFLRVPEGARTWTQGARAEGPSTDGTSHGTSTLASQLKIYLLKEKVVAFDL